MSKIKNDIHRTITITCDNGEVYIYKKDSNDGPKFENLPLEVIPTNVLNDSTKDIFFEVPDYEYRNEDYESISREQEISLEIPYNPIFRKLILYFQLDRYSKLEPAKVEYIFMKPIRPIDVLDKINEFYLEKESRLEIYNSMILEQKRYGKKNIDDINRKPLDRYEMIGASNVFAGFSPHKDGSYVKFDS
jgi:hypothetical protein